MEESHSKKLWFKAKRYGWGWYPCTWQGWTVLAVYLALIFAFFHWVYEPVSTEDAIANVVLSEFLIFVSGTTIALLYTRWKKGEKPRWRWGGKD